MTYCFILFK